MLVIKLSKIGKNKKKVFRLIISEKGRDPYGKSLEILGSYNPHTKELQAKDERIKYWISKGAQMTATVNNLLVGKNIIEGKKVVASKPGKPNEKKLAQNKAKEEKSKEAEVSAEEVKEEKPEETKAPVEEVKDEEK